MHLFFRGNMTGNEGPLDEAREVYIVKNTMWNITIIYVHTIY